MRDKRLRLWLALVVCMLSAPAYALLPIQYWQTSSGAQIYFVENRDLPMLDVSVDFPAGAAFDTRGKSGLASLTLNLLKLGAAGLSEDVPDNVASARSFAPPVGTVTLDTGATLSKVNVLVGPPTS